MLSGRTAVAALRSTALGLRPRGTHRAKDNCIPALDLPGGKKQNRTGFELQAIGSAADALAQPLVRW